MVLFRTRHGGELNRSYIQGIDLQGFFRINRFLKTQIDKLLGLWGGGIGTEIILEPNHTAHVYFIIFYR